MKEIIKASADWYFTGYGWMVMAVIGLGVGWVMRLRPKLWLPLAIIVVVVIPFVLLWARHL